ncbi:virulence factor, partial [Streptomyces adustus]
AYTTAQAAEDAGASAQQVAAPANDAIQLGSPYVTTDSAAGLVVLTGQSSKTIAEQQQAVAEAHAANAQKNAEQAQTLANAATGDAKAAYTIAAEAAGHAADARKSAKEALGYASEAAKAAADAQLSLARAIDYDQQAGEDAAAADNAAGRAEGYAKDARSSADQAAQDASAARSAAAAAEQSAKDARAAADRADAEATAAEEAAKDAQKYAESAQQAADEAERKDANKEVSTGSGTGINGVFYVVDKMTETAPAKQLNPCDYVPQGCTVTYELHVDITVSYYFCVNPDVPATEAGCPKSDTVFLKTETLKDQTNNWTHHFSMGDITRLGWQALFGEKLGAVLYEVVLGDARDCYHGNGGSCAWAAAMFVPPSMATKLAEAAKLAVRVEDAVKTGAKAAEVLADLKKIFGEAGAAQAIADSTSAAGMGLRIAQAVAERAKIARAALDPKLLEKLGNAGVKFDKANTIWVIEYAKPGVNLAWLEKGNVNAGLIHIIFRHAGEFATAGVRIEDIPALVSKALTEGTRVGTQGAGRPIYEVVFNGKTQRLAISVGDNGFVIGANPV